MNTGDSSQDEPKEVVPTPDTEPSENEKKAEQAFGEIFEHVPEPVREIMFKQMAFSGPLPNPLIEKITPAHIDKILDQCQEDGIHDHQDRKSNRWFNLVYALIAAAFIIFLVVFLAKDNKDLLTSLIGFIVAGGGGFFGGYGYGRTR
jgi:hypothetical protein